MEYNIRPLSFGEILDRALRILVDRAFLLIGIAAIFLVPERAVSLLGPRFQVLFLLVIISVAPLLHAALTTAIAEVYLDRPVTIASAYKSAWSIFLPFLGTYLLIYLLFALGGFGLFAIAIAGRTVGSGPVIAITVVGILVGVPLYFYLLIRWSLIGPTMIVERRFGLTALGRSRDLVKGVWWRTLGIIIVATVVVQIPVAALGFIWSSIPILGIILSGLGTSVAAAYSAIAIIVYYFDRRCRIEDFDLRLLAEQIRSEGAQGSPAMTGAPIA